MGNVIPLARATTEDVHQYVQRLPRGGKGNHGGNFMVQSGHAPILSDRKFMKSIRCRRGDETVVV